VNKVEYIGLYMHICRVSRFSVI